MLSCDKMSSFVTSSLLNIFLLFNNYRWEIGCYTFASQIPPDLVMKQGIM